MATKIERENMPLSRLSAVVAQLESIVTSAVQQPPDPVICFDLLSYLVLIIEDEPKESILRCQRKCEDTLYALLILGARRPIRRLASVAMARIIVKGDDISLYSRVSSLQGWLSDIKRHEPLSSAGIAQCLGELYHIFGERLTSGLLEIANTAAKLMRFHEDFVRQAALHMLQNALEGSHGSGISAAYSEAFRVITRMAVGDRSLRVRLAAAKCLQTFTRIGGIGVGVADLDSCAYQCVKALEDSVLSVRDAFAEALGTILALELNLGTKVSSKGQDHHFPERKFDEVQKYLVSPFLKANGSWSKELRIGLASSWVFLLQALCQEYFLLESELQTFALHAMNMLDGSSDAHSLACVLYILRTGIMDQMSEPTQRSFLVLLVQQLESPDVGPYKAVAALRSSSYLLITLGEVPLGLRDILDNTVVAALSHASLLVRTEAALTLRALAEVNPACIGGLISYGMATLHASRECATGEKGDNLKAELELLHGQAVMLAALLAIFPKLPFGYPVRLPKSLFIFAKNMLTKYSRNHCCAVVEREAGWLLLASLIASIPLDELEDIVFDIMMLWAAPFGGNLGSYLKQIEDLSSEIRVWSAAIDALRAFIKSFKQSKKMSKNGGIFLQPVVFYLSGALHFISSILGRQQQNQMPELDEFVTKTLVAYQCLPDPMTYMNEHSQILSICTAPFKDPSTCEESSCLRVLLDNRDACLDPSTSGRDWLEGELRAFEGGRDGIVACVWDTEFPSFPQSMTLRRMLVNQMLLFLGTLFAYLDNVKKLHVLGLMEQGIKVGKKQLRRSINLTNTCVGLLASLKTMVALRIQSLSMDVLHSAQAILLTILAEQDISTSQRRGCAEGLGLIARLGNDLFAPRMLGSMLGDLSVVHDSSYIAAVVLSFGCIHRSAGGMALSAMVPATISAIFSVAKRASASLQSWTLHSLLLIIEAAGLSYLSHTQATLSLIMDILLSEESACGSLRQGLGHLINALVAILGPELSPRSTFFSRCKFIIAEISSGHETSTLLESVRFTQQLVLFASQAAPMHSHVQALLATFSSRQPSLRHLAVSTLQHLIQKDPVSVINEQIEGSLFKLLDDETDPEISNLVCTTIKLLLYASCPSCPSRWIAVCHDMISATWVTWDPVRDSITGGQSATSFLKSKSASYYGEDDEEMIAYSHSREAKDSDDDGFLVRQTKHLRCRTRLFAAECLSQLPLAVGANPSHFDLSMARKNASVNNFAAACDWLVMHMHELISLAFQASTSDFEAMRPIGVELMITLLNKFNSIRDPELPSHLLIQQYQAPFVSAARMALNASSSPLLLDAGLQLVTKILSSRIINGDSVAVCRLYSLISRQLNNIEDVSYPSFAEWVPCRIKIRLVAAHAFVKCYMYALMKQQQNEVLHQYTLLLPMLSELSGMLRCYWIQVLNDYCYLCFGLHFKIHHKLFMDLRESSMAISKVKVYLDEFWHVILHAVSLDAVPSELGKDTPSMLAVETSRAFISGYRMVQLEVLEFHFIWGFALLILFQAKHFVGYKQIIPLRINQLAGDTTVQSNTANFDICDTVFVVLESLATKRFFCRYLDIGLCNELLQVLVCLDCDKAHQDQVVMALLLQVLQSCPDDFFKSTNFTFLAMDLCQKYTGRMFGRANNISQFNHTSEKLTSALFDMAERIIICSVAQDQEKLIVAVLSTACAYFKEACRRSCLSLVTAFIKRVLHLSKQLLAGIVKILGALQTEIFILFHNFVRRLNSVEDKTDGSGQLLLQKLSFCIEQIVSIAKLAYESQLQMDRKEDTDGPLFALYISCIKCLRLALNSANIQAQIVGLHMLKNVALSRSDKNSSMEECYLSMFLAGELLEDILSIIHGTTEKVLISGSAVIISESLKFLVLFHDMSQSSEYQKFMLALFLDAVIITVSASNNDPSKEVVEIQSSSMKLLSHLAQVSSSAAKLKEIMLEMPVAKREQLQDIIRASVTWRRTVLPMQSVFPIAAAHENNLLIQSKHLHQASSAKIHKHEIAEEVDWEAFQSFTASDQLINPLQKCVPESSYDKKEVCFEEYLEHFHTKDDLQEFFECQEDMEGMYHNGLQDAFVQFPEDA